MPAGRDERGLSLVELVVAATVLLTTLGVLGPILVSMVRNTQHVANEAEALAAARRVVDRIERDVLSAGCVTAPTSGETGPTLTMAGRDGSGAAMPVSYAIAGAELTRVVTIDGVTRSETLLGNLSGTGNGFTRLADGRVAVSLTVGVDHGRAARALGATVAPFAPDASCAT